MEYIKVSQPLVTQTEVAAVGEVLLSGAYVSGQRVAAFEREFASYVGVKHAVALSSGTAALHLSLLALGIGPGDEVIVPSMTFFATATAVLHAGAKPVFADIDENFCLDPQSVETQLTPRTKALIPVHLFGYAADLDALQKLAQTHSLAVVEDCAQAIGTVYGERKVGSIGDAGAYSFFATKNMTTGEGGMLTTNEDALAELARMLRSHGMQGRDDHVVLGYNYRMTEMEAAIGSIQLQKLDNFNQRRRENSHYLYDHIRELSWIRLQSFDPRVIHSFFWCPIIIEEEAIGISTAAVRQQLHEAGIGTRQRYQEPLYRQPMLRENSPYPRRYDVTCPFNGTTARYEDLHFPNAEKFAGRLLGLPNHPGLDRRQLDRVVEVLHSIK